MPPLAPPREGDDWCGGLPWGNERWGVRFCGDGGSFLYL